MSFKNKCNEYVAPEIEMTEVVVESPVFAGSPQDPDENTDIIGYDDYLQLSGF